VLSDARDVTSVETTTKPIEVRLSRPHLEVTCRIVFPDGTAIAVGVDALSILDAQHEMTAWLIEQGYEPAGCWSTQNQNDRQAARTFRHQDPSSGLPGPPPGTPSRSWSPEHGPDLDQPRGVDSPRGLDPLHGPARPVTPRGPARPVAPRVRRSTALVSRADRERAYSPHSVETELRAWAQANARRDDVIRAAAAAGVSLHRIQEVTGIARTTIMRILGSPPRSAPHKSP